VLVSVRRALAGADLGQLRDAVEREFLTLTSRRKASASWRRMEGDLIRRMATLHDD